MTEAPVAELAGDQEWQRLDPRMLLVHPIREVGRFIIPLLAFFVAGSATENPWQYLTIAIPIALGLARYLTTSFRIAEGRVELKRGLLSRHVLSTQLDRVRTVDLTASPIHRVLGLTTVKIGTGIASTGEDGKLDLDGLPAERARQLRAELMRFSTGSATGTARPSGHRPRLVAAVQFDPSWLRFAPFTSAGVVMRAAVLGVRQPAPRRLDVFEISTSTTVVAAPPTWIACSGCVGLASPQSCCRWSATWSPTGGSGSPTPTGPGT